MHDAANKASESGGAESGAEQGAAALQAEVAKAWGTVNDMVEGFFSLLPKMVVAAVVFVILLVVAWLLKGFVRRLTRNRNQHIGRVLGRLAQWAMILVAIMVAVAIVAPSVTPAELLGALGVGSVAIGFAFKDVLQNFLAGILILARQPFKVGDAVQFNDTIGYIQEIDTRLTVLKTYDGRQVLIPNGAIYTNPITVLTAYDSRREEYDFGIGYGQDIGKVSDLILKTVRETEGVLSEPEPEVLVHELAGSTVNLRARWWTEPKKRIKTKSRVIGAVLEACEDAEIDMPFPTQTLLMHDQTGSRDGDRERNDERQSESNGASRRGQEHAGTSSSESNGKAAATSA